MKKGMSVFVYRNSLGDCTADGVSKTRDQFVVVDPALPEIFNVPEDGIYLVIVRRNIGGLPYQHLEPRKDGKPLHEGYSPMAGGNFAGTSDSRWRGITLSELLPIHDRFEFH